MIKATMKEILKRKAEYPVRLIATHSFSNDYDTPDIYTKGDEFGIEAIDFSMGSIRVCNKNKNTIQEVYYSKETGELYEQFTIKE